MIGPSLERYAELAASRETRKVQVAEIHTRDQTRTVQRTIGAQILRASEILRHNSIDRVFSGNFKQQTTPWANLRYDLENDQVVQAQLFGNFGRRALLFTGAVDTVQIYSRVSSISDFEVFSSKEPVALFNARDQKIIVPDPELNYPQEGRQVLPDTEPWQELDLMLTQLEFNAFDQPSYFAGHVS